MAIKPYHHAAAGTPTSKSIPVLLMLADAS